MDTLTKPKSTPKGTKRSGKRPRKRATSIRLDPAIYERATQLAEAEKRSFSQYVELALEQYMQEQQALARHFPPGAVYPVFTPYGEEAVAAELTELLKGRSQ